MTTSIIIVIALISLAVLLWIFSPFYFPLLGKTLVKMDMSSQLSKCKLQEKSVTLENGRTAWYLERMNKQETDEKPLVVVPGLSAYMRLMGVQFADLLKLIPNRRVIIFELPYHGKRASMNESFVDPGCSLDAMTASLERFLNKIGFSSIHLLVLISTLLDEKLFIRLKLLSNSDIDNILAYTDYVPPAPVATAAAQLPANTTSNSGTSNDLILAALILVFIMLVVMLFLVQKTLKRIALASGVDISPRVKEKRPPLWKVIVNNHFLIFLIFPSKSI